MRSKDIFKNRDQMSLHCVVHTQDLCRSRDRITPCKDPPAAESRDTLSSAKAPFFIFSILQIFSYLLSFLRWIVDVETHKKWKLYTFLKHFLKVILHGEEKFHGIPARQNCDHIIEQAAETDFQISGAIPLSLTLTQLTEISWQHLSSKL